jgi:hypothetical protein
MYVNHGDFGVFLSRYSWWENLTWDVLSKFHCIESAHWIYCHDQMSAYLQALFFVASIWPGYRNSKCLMQLRRVNISLLFHTLVCMFCHWNSWMDFGGSTLKFIKQISLWCIKPVLWDTTVFVCFENDWLYKTFFHVMYITEFVVFILL